MRRSSRRRSDPGGRDQQGLHTIDTAEGHYTFDSIYPALGSDTHVQLAEMTGASLSKDANIVVDSHQRAGVPGLYAAGDVVIGLDQISHAMGEGGVAATTIATICARGGRAGASRWRKWRRPVAAPRRETPAWRRGRPPGRQFPA